MDDRAGLCSGPAAPFPRATFGEAVVRQVSAAVLQSAGVMFGPRGRSPRALTVTAEVSPIGGNPGTIGERPAGRLTRMPRDAAGQIST